VEPVLENNIGKVSNIIGISQKLHKATMKKSLMWSYMRMKGVKLVKNIH